MTASASVAGTQPAPASGWLRYAAAACRPWRHSGRDPLARQMLNAKTRLGETLNMLPVPIVTADQFDRIVFANERAAQLFGYTCEELIGASTAMLFPGSGQSAANPAGAARGAGNQAAQGATPGATAGATAQTLIARRRDGVSFPAEAETSHCRISNQLLQITAISDWSKCPEFGRNPKELEHLARASSLGELAGSLAHELKQPLTAILFNAQAAKKFVDSENVNLVELREALEDIVSDNCRANDVIQKIRALVRKGDVELQLLDLGSVVRDIALLVHSDALTREVRTRFDIADNLALVCGDRVQLQQVVLNLLLNAFDAVKDCAPADRLVETIVREEPDGHVRITVKDRGQGLTVDNMDKIFRPFFTTKPQGLGLGLSISRTIATAHQGRLWAENNDDRGASFHLTLPLSRGGRQPGELRA
ncbi:ATP-binding protein [Burkholderia sp. SRS-W-2-2016]|uniref:ATP-binding protein n=1 Tax=Burkholderia sp. SRS-W-2-2016 TaxID=1926878 RepID=UPI00211642D5|nr:ATP-binding protein [Burkholderia sp. SRS-W-2-2016]